VKDTGPGIAPEALSRIFDPFYSTKEKGTGLGLPFAQQVVQEHGGTIRCDSAPGAGTTFTVRLPRAEERAGAAAGMEALEA
jgi:signal transduction histidine kinase